MLETFKWLANKIIGNKKQTSSSASNGCLEDLKTWIVSEYPQATCREAEFTESAYVYVDGVKIRLSDHIQNNMSNKDLYIVKTAGNDNIFMVMMQHSKQPFTMEYDELKSFVKHFLMINQANENHKKGEDASTKMKEAKAVKLQQIKTSVPVKKQPALAVDSMNGPTIAENVQNVRFTIYLNRFNENDYINKNWKAFEQQYLIKDLPWYGKIERSDIRRNYMSTIVSKCAYNGLNYQETLEFIGQNKTIKEIEELRSLAQEKFDTEKQKEKRFVEAFPKLEIRLSEWDEFQGRFAKLYPWYNELAPTNKNTIMQIYKTKDIGTHWLNTALMNTYEKFGNMKWGACVAFKAEVKELENSKKQKEEEA